MNSEAAQAMAFVQCISFHPHNHNNQTNLYQSLERQQKKHCPSQICQTRCTWPSWHQQQHTSRFSSSKTTSASTFPTTNPSISSGTKINIHGIASLHAGTWFKLICGASTHDVATVRNLSEVYTTAGVDCIDVAADQSIITAAKQGIHGALENRGATNAPLLMISVNDGGDIHFRKAYFDASKCPSDCKRPCQHVCPADAISLSSHSSIGGDGVQQPKCYGCGRCFPVCPYGFIHTRDVVHDIPHIRSLISSDDVDALEIHTGPNRLDLFHDFFLQIEDVVQEHLKVIAVSFPDVGFGNNEKLAYAIESMWNQSLCRVITPSSSSSLSSYHVQQPQLIWQVDGRPMSGDIGPGTAKAAVSLAKRVRTILTLGDIPGHVQLAGGTNWKTVPLMTEAGILRKEENDMLKSAAGVAMGGYARKIVRDALGCHGRDGEEMTDESFENGVSVAHALVQAIKG